MTERRARHSRSQVLTIAFLLLLSTGCKKTNSGGPESPHPQRLPPRPPPLCRRLLFPPRKRSGCSCIPKTIRATTSNSRMISCYTQVQQQTGIDPDAAAPSGPSAAQVQAAEQQAAANAPQAQGGRVRGAAKGAAGGAMVGAITGNAGRGGGCGATVGTVRGGRKQRQANEQSQQQAAESAGAQAQQQANQAKAAYNKQMDTFKRGFSACMDARGYSVK